MTAVLALILTLSIQAFAFTTSTVGKFCAYPFRSSSSFGNSFRKNTLHGVKKMSASSTDTKSLLLDCPAIKLRNGMEHPSIGFGTYKVGFIPASASAAVAGTTNAGSGELRSAKDCVADALSVGYRSLECAEFYGNEAQVGQAIAESGIDRKDLFLCSKVWTTTIEKGPEAICAQLEKTLADLRTDYLDLYLIHWPVPGHHIAAYKQLIQLRNEGKIRGIGVSNYALEDYLELKEAGIPEADLPLVNQIEINPLLYRKNTIAALEKEGVVMQSYRSLRDGKAFDNATIKEIAAAHGKTAAQILGRWCIQKGVVYTPKSVKRERMVENAAVFDFELSPTDMDRLDALTTNDALETFQGLYRKCVNRDTSKDGTMDGVKMDITMD